MTAAAKNQYSHLTKRMMPARGSDLPSLAPSTKAPAASTARFSARALAPLRAAPAHSVLDAGAINGAHPNHSAWESTATAWISGQELVLGLLLFTTQIPATSLPD